MKTVVMFDLGNTLERGGMVAEGAMEMLTAVQTMVDGDGDIPVAVLVSDFTMADSPAELPALQQQYYAIVAQLGLAGFFHPFESRITLSTEVGVFKPDKVIFRRAIDKISATIPFEHSMFLTESASHVAASRVLGIVGVQLKMPGQNSADIDHLADFVPKVRSWLKLLS